MKLSSKFTPNDSPDCMKITSKRDHRKKHPFTQKKKKNLTDQTMPHVVSPPERGKSALLERKIKKEKKPVARPKRETKSDNALFENDSSFDERQIFFRTAARRTVDRSAVCRWRYRRSSMAVRPPEAHRATILNTVSPGGSIDNSIGDRRTSAGSAANRSILCLNFLSSGHRVRLSFDPTFFLFFLPVTFW